MRNNLIIQLHRKYFGSLRAYALKYTRDEITANELASDVFLKVNNFSDERLDELEQYSWEHETELVNYDRAFGYLMKMLKSTFIDNFRKRGTRYKNEMLYSDVYKNSDTRTPEEICISNENIQEIFDALDDIFRETNVEKSMSFVLKYQGYKAKEIAEILRIPENTVHTNVRRIRLKLRERISIAR